MSNPYGGVSTGPIPMTYLGKLKIAVETLSNNALKVGWDYRVGGQVVQEAVITAGLYRELLVQGIPLSNIRVDSHKARDLTIYDGLDRKLAVEVKRVYFSKGNRSTGRDWVLTRPQGIPGDIKKLKEDRAPEKALVVFDPEDKLEIEHVKRDTSSSPTLLSDLCARCGKSSIELFLIPALGPALQN